VCKNEKLQDLDSTALAKFVEHGSRLAGNQEKLSTNFGLLSDVIREANYYALLEGADLVSKKHINQAIEEQFYRSNLIQERVREMIENETVLIDVQGEKIGQVNGLSVIGLGEISFGQPNRITASVGMGRDGVVNIEREAQLSGPLHTKGVLILSGYLLEQYAQNKPLSLSARVVFEQSYSGVDGDSASSTELYAILSALSGTPIRQGVAVTGSVNQKGEVQAIGGVNEKIEGYFEVCKVKGLSGQQGVMIPHSNISHLMLKDEVIEAVQEEKFHIWPVKTIDEGLEILTGRNAGKRDETGGFEEGSLHGIVNKRLQYFADKMSEHDSLNT
jgi:lon-related putative ATP-dependent protease